jgi:hypothetical protein
MVLSSHLDVEWMLPHHQRPVVSHVHVGILVRHRSDGHHTGIEWTPRRRLAWQKVLNFSFVSAKRVEEDTKEVNLVLIGEHEGDSSIEQQHRATGYFVIHQTLIYLSAVHDIQQHIFHPLHRIQPRNE